MLQLHFSVILNHSVFSRLVSMMQLAGMWAYSHIWLYCHFKLIAVQERFPGYKEEDAAAWKDTTSWRKLSNFFNSYTSADEEVAMPIAQEKTALNLAHL